MLRFDLSSVGPNPQGVLTPEQYDRMASLLQSGAPKAEIKETANELRMQLSPHPAGQLINANVKYYLSI